MDAPSRAHDQLTTRSDGGTHGGDPLRVAAPAPHPAPHHVDGRCDREREAWRAARRALEAQRRHSTPDGMRRVVRIPDWLKVGIGLGLRAVGLWRRGVANGLDVRLRRLDLQLPRLPAPFDGYRILHLTDPHFDATDGLAQVIVECVRGLEVDLCALTGDLRQEDHGPFTEFEVLEPLRAIREQVRARDGFLATLGNHDRHEMVEPIERLGWRVLLNETARIGRAGRRIALTGIDDVHRFYTPGARAALDRSDPDAFGIVLAHSPELAGEAAAAGYGLYLCGHCHGGQVCLPGGRPVLTRLGRHKEYYRGLWRCGDLVGYTSHGCGLSGDLPVRFNCPAEITLITLRADQEEWRHPR